MCFFSHNFGHLLRPLELVPAPRERVVPTEWQVRAVLGYCMSRAKVIPTQAPQYRQHALISDFLDLAHLSIREQAALATNWIKDRPELLKLQNLALATMTGPTLSSFAENFDCRRPVRHWQMRVFGRRATFDPSRESIGTWRGFSPHMAVLRRHFLPSARNAGSLPIENMGRPVHRAPDTVRCTDGRRCGDASRSHVKTRQFSLKKRRRC